MAGRFKKIQRIGRGTFGEAWLVTSTCSGRKYVIKEVRVEDMSEEELEKTRTEATILARCKHSSIIRYKEYFMQSSPTTMCLVMEYADGGDLSLRVKDAKKKGVTLPEDTVLHWFVQVIFAVQYLHRNNILHRDLKTQNIFLTKTNLVKVGDFGIARFLRDKQDLATTAIGTPYYLSPEICQRRPYNHKSDMWAVGCILYELCALKHPFDADTFEDLIIKILRGVVQPLSSAFTSLVQDLTTVMLRTNPERRPTADALLMLPALKPYVENYLHKHEELLSSRTPAAHSVQDKLLGSPTKERKQRSSLDLNSAPPRRDNTDLREHVLKAEVHPRPHPPSITTTSSSGPDSINHHGGGGLRARCVSDSAIRRDLNVVPPSSKCSTAPRIHESATTSPSKDSPHFTDANHNVLEHLKGEMVGGGGGGGGRGSTPSDFSETYIIMKGTGNDGESDSVFEM